MKKISKHLCEIRYKPDPKILDKRGEIANSIADTFFSSWQISNNRIDFKNNKDENASAFYSFRNLGFTTNTPHDSKKFLELGGKFVKNSWNYFQGNNILRIGVKSSFFIDLGKNFNQYFDFYKKYISVFTDKKTFNADLVDIGLNLNYANGDEYFNIMTGPMEQEQAELFFGKELDFSKNGIYIEIDYFKKDFSPTVKQKDILALIEKGIKKADEVVSAIIEQTK